MKSKICIKCGEEKSLTSEYWNKKKTSKDGYRNECKTCMKEYQAINYKKNKQKLQVAGKKYYKENKEQISERNKQYYEDNKDKITECQRRRYVENKKQILKYQKEYYKLNKLNISERSKQYNKENKKQILEYQKQYYEDNKEKVLMKSKLWYENNKDSVAIQSKQYYESNKERIAKQSKQYYKENREERLEYSKQYSKENRVRYRQHWQKYMMKKNELTCTLTIKQWGKIKKYFNNSCAYCGMTEEEHYMIYGEQLHQDHFIPLSKGGGYKVSNIIPACRSCNSSKHNNFFNDWYFDYKHYNKERHDNITKYISSVNSG